MNNKEIIEKIRGLKLFNSRETIPINSEMRLKLKLKDSKLVDIRLIYKDKTIKTGECAQDDDDKTIEILLNDFNDEILDIYPDTKKDDEEEMLTPDQVDELLVDYDYALDDALRACIRALKYKCNSVVEMHNALIDVELDMVNLNIIGVDIDEIIEEEMKNDI